MARARSSSSSTATLAIFVLCMTLVGQSYAQLRKGFYLGKCGRSNVESVIFDVVRAAFQRDRTIVAALLRMQFHDCFVRAGVWSSGFNPTFINLILVVRGLESSYSSLPMGCDASLLLDGSNTEKTAGSNGSVRGYELIDACKAVLEQRCPGVVSCSDIIVIATRVAVVLAQGRWYDVETGRRDGVVSSASEAQATLPGPRIPVPVAIDIFRRRGMSADDFVLLIGGGHTVGIIHCNFFLERLYNFQGTQRADPSMNPSTLSAFRARCPRSGQPNNFVFGDQTVGSELRVDNGYFKAIRQGKGVLQIDQQLAFHRLTWQTVQRLSMTGDFQFQFGAAMVKLGRVGVLTGSQGQIRRNCRRTN